MAMDPLFTWVHLSDIHIGHGDAAHGWDQRLVLRALRDDLASRSGPRRVDAIFVTGDIAFSGKAEQYAEARAWLDDVGRAVGVGPGRVFVVPGNHDVDRAVDRDRDIARLLRDLRSGEEPLDTALAHAPDREKLATRMAAYLDFAAGLAPACLGQAAQPRDQRLFWRHQAEHDWLRLRILGLNTALLAADGQDQGRLAVGNEQLGMGLLEPPMPDELVIALSHHPLQGGWLADERMVARWLRTRVHVHLSGHIHDAFSEAARSGNGSLWVSITAGAAHAEAQPVGAPSGHGYAIGSVLADAAGVLTCGCGRGAGPRPRRASCSTWTTCSMGRAMRTISSG
jgi:calcineurin-like phosphoesterase family protein